MLLTSQSPASEINPVETKCAFDHFFFPASVFSSCVCVCFYFLFFRNMCVCVCVWLVYMLYLEGGEGVPSVFFVGSGIMHFWLNFLIYFPLSVTLRNNFTFHDSSNCKDCVLYM